ncbi:D-lactate ferricytochrome c oxidoreductase [Xylographa trunciseda]|nr:D-lactate ferricytochrome c oxidoreductase [Xylographa trunciseda]
MTAVHLYLELDTPKSCCRQDVMSPSRGASGRAQVLYTGIVAALLATVGDKTPIDDSGSFSERSTEFSTTRDAKISSGVQSVVRCHEHSRFVTIGLTALLKSRTSAKRRSAVIGATSTGYLIKQTYFGKNSGQRHEAPLQKVTQSAFLLPMASTLPLSHVVLPAYDISVANLEAARTEFTAIIGKDNISDRSDDIDRHTGSEWSSHPTTATESPTLILFPDSTKEVSQVVEICNRRRIPIVAFSGGTSLEGQFANTRKGICIDFSRLNKILKVHKDDLDVVVQPGVGYEELNELLAEDNLFFPPDPGPGAMIGGMVGTGCSGTNAYRYGTMREWVISLTVVLADGTIIKTRQRPRKSSAGYDLTRLFIGSEGTLGLVTEAVLKVTVKPMHETVAIAAFPSIRAAANTVANVVNEGIQVAAVEILDDANMKLINDSGATSREWIEAPTLFFKFNGSPAGVQEQINIVKELAKTNQCLRFDFAADEEEANDLWGCRKTALWAAMGLKKNEDDHAWITDVAVPISRLAEIIELTKADLNACGLIGGVVGHVGDGNFHSLMLFSEAERPIAEGVVHRMVERAIQMEGTVTGEHGVGLVKRDYLNSELGETTVDLMRQASPFPPL